VIRAWRQAALDAPDTVAPEIALWTIPRADFIKEATSVAGAEVEPAAAQRVPARR